MFPDLKTVASAFPEVKMSFQNRLNLYILIAISTGIILTLSLFNLAGPFGEFVGDILRASFGRGAFLIVLFFFITTYVLLRVQNRKTIGDIFNTRLIVGSIIMFASFLGILSMFFGVRQLNDIKAGGVGGGGFIGYILYPVTLDFFGVIGGFVILLAIFLFGFFVFTQRSITDIIYILTNIHKNPELFWDMIPDIATLSSLPKSEPNYADSIIDEVKRKAYADAKIAMQQEEIINEVKESVEQNIDINDEQEDEYGSIIKKHSKEVDTKDELDSLRKSVQTTTIDVETVEQIKSQSPNSEKKTKNETKKPQRNFPSAGGWQSPDIGIFKEVTTQIKGVEPEDENKTKIVSTLGHFSILAAISDVKIGPTVSQYKFKPVAGIKLSRISALHQDLSLALAAKSLRMQLPVPGESVVSIEIPNKFPREVRIKELVDTNEFFNYTDDLPIPIGKSVSGENLFFALTKAPHLLVAGATGSGKSVWINSMLMSLLYKYSPKRLQLILVDMKMVELNLYDGIPHLLTEVITLSDKAINALKWCVFEMDKRFQILREHGKRNISDYNEFAERAILEPLPYIVVVIDELADLMMQAKNEVEPIIARLTAMSRAVGIHLVLGTQRPDVNIVTGLIKTNIPTRLCFAVATQIDSRVILDSNGGETLLGFGDGLFKSPRTLQPVRFQGANVGEIEVRAMVHELISQKKLRPEFDNYNPNVVEPPVGTINVPGLKKSKPEINDNEDLYAAAKELVLDMQMCSVSILSGNLGVHARIAKQLIDELEENGVIGSEIPGTTSREVLMTV
jgi:DNA segregation ATPase FtsK/SpoIIIE, S-DNA-T family